MAYENTDQTEHTPGYDQKPKPCPHCPDDPDDCDPQLIASYRCRADRLAKESEVWASEKQELADARAKYGDVLTAYRNKRSQVAPQVVDMRSEVTHLIERIRCMIQQHHVVHCLDRAFRCIEERLEECADYKPPLPGCDFDLDWCDLTLEAIIARLSDYDDRLTKWKARFHDLEGEPQRLEDRIKKRKEGIEAIKAGLLGDAATTDLKRLYAMAIIEWLWLTPAQVWWGFKDTNAFVDALCQALTCWAKAVEAKAVLSGAAEQRKCEEKAKADDCQKLKDRTVDELLLVYERLCPKPPCDDEDKEPCGEEPSKSEEEPQHSEEEPPYRRGGVQPS